MPKRVTGKRRIAFVGGGAHTIPSYRALLEALSERYDITVYSEFYLEKKSTAYAIRSVPPFKLPTRVKYLLFFLMLVKDQLIRRFDLVHSHSTYPSGYCCILLKKIFRVPVVVSLDAAEASAIPSIHFGDLLNPRRKKINDWVVREANEVMVLTHFLEHEVQQNLAFTRPMHVVPRGVDRQRFQFKEKTLTQPIRFLNVAYLHPVKDQRMLLRCFALIAEQLDATLTLIGADYEQGAIQQLATALGLNDKVFFQGFVPNEQLPSYYEQADVLLHTSVYESQAVAVSEAMACGVLVCGTHVGLMADLSGRCCLTVAPGDAAALAQTVIALLKDKDEVKRLVYHAYQWMGEHDLAWTAGRHDEVYELCFV